MVDACFDFLKPFIVLSLSHHFHIFRERFWRANVPTDTRPPSRQNLKNKCPKPTTPNCTDHPWANLGTIRCQKNRRTEYYKFGIVFCAFRKASEPICDGCLITLVWSSDPFIWFEVSLAFDFSQNRPQTLDAQKHNSLNPSNRNQSTPWILTNRFCYPKVSERTISLVFLTIRLFGHTLNTNNILFLSLFWMHFISLLYL